MRTRIGRRIQWDDIRRPSISMKANLIDLKICLFANYFVIDAKVIIINVREFQKSIMILFK